MQNKKALTLAIILLLIMFLVDSLLPPGMGLWLFYIFPAIFIADKISNRNAYLFAAVTTLLMVIGFILSLHLEYSPFETAALNRFAGIVVIWVSVALVRRRANAYLALNESASLNNTILSNMTEGIIILGADGKLQRWNKAAMQISRRAGEPADREQPMFQNLWQLQDLSGKPLPLQSWPASRVLRHERFHAEVLRVIQPQTKELWFGSFSGVPIFDTDNKLSLAIITFRDVTPIKETEKQLKDAVDLAEKRTAELSAKGGFLNALMEQIPESIFITGPGGEILYASRYTEQLFEMPLEEIVSIPERNRPEKWHIFHSDEKTLSQPEEQPLFRAVHTGEIIHDQEWIVKRDGKAKTVLIDASPIHDEQGRIRGAISGWRDITEQVTTRKEAEFQVARYEAITSNLTDGLIITDPEGNLLSMNPAAQRIYQFKSTSKILKKYQDYPSLFELYDLQNNSVPFENWPLSRALRGEKFTGSELQVRRTDTGKMWFANYSGTPVFNSKGQFILAILTIRDITELRKAVRAAEEGKRILDAMMEYIPMGVLIASAPELKVITSSTYDRKRVGECSGMAVLDRARRCSLRRSDTNEPVSLDTHPLYRTLNKSEIVINEEWRFNDTNGNEIVALINASPLIDQNGTITGAVLMWLDITERKLGEQAMVSLMERNRNQRIFLETLLEKVPAGIATLRGKEMIYERANSYYRTMLNKSNLKLEGKSINEVFPQLINTDAIKCIRKTFTKKESLSLRELYFPFTGSKSPLYCNIDIIPLISETGRVERVMMVVVNVTELVESRKKLEFQTARYQTIVGTMTEGLIIVDPEGLIREINPAAQRLLEISNNKIEHHYSELASQISVSSPDGNPIPVTSWSFARALQGETITGEIMRIDVYSSGKKWFALTSGSPFKIPDGESTHAVINISDITELMHTQELLRNEQHRIATLNTELLSRATELEFANSELEAFSYSVSHDLRSPLSTIEGFTTLLAQEYGPVLDNAAKEYIAYTLSGIKNMQNIINDMLQLSRISRHEMTRKNINLSKMVLGFLETLHTAEPDRRVENSVQENIMAYADPRLIHLALENLLRNAWKFTSKKPFARIEFGSFLSHDKTIYYIRDNGAGFDPQKTDKLFRPFTRLHSQRDFKGTGIGLPIVLRVIRRHGGEVWAEGEIDKGATFYFTLG